MDKQAEPVQQRDGHTFPQCDPFFRKLEGDPETHAGILNYQHGVCLVSGGVHTHTHTHTRLSLTLPICGACDLGLKCMPKSYCPPLPWSGCPFPSKPSSFPFQLVGPRLRVPLPGSSGLSTCPPAPGLVPPLAPGPAPSAPMCLQSPCFSLPSGPGWKQTVAGRDPRSSGPSILVPLRPPHLTCPPKDPRVPAGRWQEHLAVKFLAKFFTKGRDSGDSDQDPGQMEERQ